MTCLLLSIPSWFSKELHTHFLLSFLKNPVLLGVFDVHHKHSEAWEGRKKKKILWNIQKPNLQCFGFTSTWKQRYVARTATDFFFFLNEPISKPPSYLFQCIFFGEPLLWTFLLSPCDSNGASGIQDWPITVLYTPDQ